MSCDHISGECDGGCLSGWMGDRCDQSESKTLKKYSVLPNSV